MSIQQEFFLKWFIYRDGKIYWRRAPYSGPIKKGDRAGNQRKDGYRALKLLGENYSEHCIIWVMHHGDIPAGYEIDHEDRVRNNNILSNLRLATSAANSQNSGNVLNATSKYFGVHRTANWVANPTVNGKSMNLGTYTAEIDAARAVNIYLVSLGLDVKNHVDFPLQVPIPRRFGNANIEARLL